MHKLIEILHKLADHAGGGQALHETIRELAADLEPAQEPAPSPAEAAAPATPEGEQA